jgi:hypothetical protein
MLMNARTQMKIVALALVLLGCTGFWKLHGQGLDGPDFQDFGKYSGLMAPLDIPLILAGNFGELRADHFHTGLDFKTQGREGFPVIAATDGVVARVKISPFGYGRALYLSSPEGLTTVYAHLQRFAPVVEQWALDRQYERQTFAIDEAPKRAFAFSQGDTIGWSGNSGGSAGPHLHFEVRETRTQRPINPFFWGFDVPDAKPPTIQGLWVLPVGGGGVNGSSVPVRFAAKSKGRIRVSGGVRLAVEAVDLLDGASNRCGVYRSELWVDQERRFAWQLDTLDFSCNRDMNAHALYSAWERTGEQVHRLHRLPGNRLPIYESSAVSDLIYVNDSVPSVVEIKAWDVHGNFTIEQWLLESDTLERDDDISNRIALFPYDSPLKLEHAGAVVSVPAGAFYEDFAFELKPMKSDLGIQRWALGSRELPAVKNVRVALPIDDALHATQGLVAGRFGLNGQVEEVYNGECSSQDRFEFETKTLGVYELLVDSISPVIRPHKRHVKSGFGDTLVVSNFHELRFDLADNLSGIDSWEGSLNDEWILFRWDPKRERVWYELTDRRHPTGQAPQRLELRAKDKAGNEVSWKGWVVFNPA